MSSRTGGCCGHHIPRQNTSGMLMRTWCHTLPRILLVGSFIRLLSIWRGEKYPLLEAKKSLMVCVAIKGDYASLKTTIAFICKVAAPPSVSFIKMQVLAVLWQR